MNETRTVTAIIDVALAALSSHAGSDPLQSLLDGLRSAVGADAAGYYEHVHQGLTTTVQVSPPEIWPRLPFTEAPTIIAARLHPGIRHLIRSKPTGPFMVSDLVSERDWWNSELGTLMRPEWGRNHQMLLPASYHADIGLSNVFVLGRLQDRFSETDRSLSRQLLRILSLVSRHWAAVDRWDARELIGSLTARESIVLRMAASGLGAARIAAELGISPRTVHKHLEHAYRKLDVHDRHQAKILLAENRLHGFAFDSTGPPIQ